MMTATDNDDMNDLSEHFSFIDDDRSVSSLLPALSFQDSGGGGDDDEMNQIALQLSEEGGVHVSSFESGYSSDQDVAKLLDDLDGRDDIESRDPIDDFTKMMLASEMAQEADGRPAALEEREPPVESSDTGLEVSPLDNEDGANIFRIRYESSPFFEGREQSPDPDSRNIFRPRTANDICTTDCVPIYSRWVSPTPRSEREDLESATPSMVTASHENTSVGFDFTDFPAPTPKAAKKGGSVWYDMTELPADLLLQRVESFSASEVYPKLIVEFTGRPNDRAQVLSQPKLNRDNESIASQTRNHNIQGDKNEHHRLVRTPYGMAVLMSPEQPERKRSGLLTASSSEESESAWNKPSESSNIQDHSWSKKDNFILQYAVGQEGQSPHSWQKISKNYFSDSRSALECKNRWMKMLYYEKMKQHRDMRQEKAKRYRAQQGILNV